MTKGARLPRRIREKLLRDRGLEVGHYKRITEAPQIPDLPAPGSPEREEKTLAMVAIERVFGQDIDELLMERPELGRVAAKLGISRSTVSKWRLARGLRTEGPINNHRHRHGMTAAQIQRLIDQMQGLEESD